jgi:hypothetical protein
MYCNRTNKVPDLASTTGNKFPVRAIWEDLEKHLMDDATCDVLSILDCCFAGDIHKGGNAQEARTYQLLSATGPGRKTRSPGPESFTTSLIECLSELMEEYNNIPFTVAHLCDRMRQKKPENPPQLWDRLYKHERMIFLVPQTVVLGKPAPLPFKPSAAFLTLRVALSEDGLVEEQVKTMGKMITKAAKESCPTVRRVDLVRYSVSTNKWSKLKKIHGVVRFSKTTRDSVSSLIPQCSEDLPVTPSSEGAPLAEMDGQTRKIESDSSPQNPTKASSPQPPHKRRRLSSPYSRGRGSETPPSGVR